MGVYSVRERTYIRITSGPIRCIRADPERMGIVMTGRNINQEFIKAARLLYGGRWIVPVAQRAGVSPESIQRSLDANQPVHADVVATVVDLMRDQEARLRDRRRALEVIK